MTANRFARHIGLSRAESIYQIKRGYYGISRNMADRVTTYFPAVSKGWLLSGEGSMLRCEPADIGKDAESND